MACQSHSDMYHGCVSGGSSLSPGMWTFHDPVLFSFPLHPILSYPISIMDKHTHTKNEESWPVQAALPQHGLHPHRHPNVPLLKISLFLVPISPMLILDCFQECLVSQLPFLYASNCFLYSLYGLVNFITI